MIKLVKMLKILEKKLEQKQFKKLLNKFQHYLKATKTFFHLLKTFNLKWINLLIIITVKRIWFQMN